MDHIHEGLYVGDIDDGERETDKRTVSLCRKAFDHTDRWHPLQDGRNRQCRFDAAVRALVDELDAHDEVLVHCNMGISRSPTVAMAALITHYDMNMEEAVETVKEGREQANPHPDLLDNLQRYDKHE